MSHLGLGVIEGFFGPEWSWENRKNMCKFIHQNGGSFYLYAPKRDSFLRKKWHQPHPEKQWNELLELSKYCSSLDLKFGVGLSPFEIHKNWNALSKQQLKQKILYLNELNPDYIGLFFDDMKAAPNLAEVQADLVEYVRGLTSAKIVFCPTFYSPDPILEKVFGKCPKGYFDFIGSQISQEVAFFWTGQKVIPDSISKKDVEIASSLLQRSPIIWDNLFANDGPRNCKYLKLKPFSGRSKAAFNASSGWALNPMNQAHLSMVNFLSAALVILEDADSEEAFSRSLLETSGASLKGFVLQHQKILLQTGLDKIKQDLKPGLIAELELQEPFMGEIADWLNNKYLVGDECLTD